MSQDRTTQQPRHFAGTNTHFLLSYLRSHARPGAVEEVLERAGEPRSPETLSDDASWTSYAQFRRLLEAAAIVLGGPQSLMGVGLDAFSEMTTPNYTQMLQSLGSPAALYADIGTAGASLAPIVSIRGEEVGPTEWLIEESFRDGCEPFEEYCWYASGLLAVTPQLFGYPPADVVEEACQRHGAPECRFRVTWKVIGEPQLRAEYLQTRLQIMESSFEAMQHTVEDLVSGDELEAVLARIVTSAAQAVRAPHYVLEIDALPGFAGGVYGEGLDREEAVRIAAELRRGEHRDDSGCLVVEVASRRRVYGRLAAINPSGSFYPQEHTILQAYGRLAAAALDSAAALEEARRQTTTAETLLELSTALAEVASTDEMAARLARAVTAAIDCDQSVVVLVDDDDAANGHIAGAFGYPADIGATLIGRRVPLDGRATPVGSVLFAVPGTAGSVGDELMAKTGSIAGASVPIRSNGRELGFVTASVTHDAGRLTDSVELAARLRGLAAQAATAISNALLLDQIRHQALHDALTGLPNRALILDRAELMLARARARREHAVALFVDLDDFKDVNDTLGHAVGDQLLQAVGKRLTGALRDCDTVGRLGGDEFIVLADGASLSGGADRLASRLQEALRAPFTIEGREGLELTVSASIGIASSASRCASDLLKDADIALYRAKAEGKGRFVRFEPAMQSEMLDRLGLATELREAKATGQFFLLYQPTLNLRRMEVTGVEALLRWRHPTRGVVQPDGFIPVLEETGGIIEVGRWVLMEACRQTAEWQRRGSPLEISVNVSMHQLESDRLVQDVIDALTVNGLNPGVLTLEVTETTLMHDRSTTVARLAELKAIGVRTAIDDFGTGYSSLAYLRQFPVDALKIDRSFVAGIAESPGAGALIHTLVELGKGLGLETVAEGIEDERQLEHLRLQGCTTGQGFLFARPLPADEIEAFVARQAATVGPTHERPQKPARRLADRCEQGAPDRADVRAPAGTRIMAKVGRMQPGGRSQAHPVQSERTPSTKGPSRAARA